MSREQRDALDALLRDGPLDLGGELVEQRAVMEQLMASIPLAPDITTSSAQLGSIAAVLVETPDVTSERVVLYIHGGAYALGSAAGGVGLAADVSRRARARAYSVDYRLAPEHPFPAGPDDCLAAYRALLDDGVEPGDVAIVGESAGGGLVATTLLGAKRDGLPQPACAVLMSPWVDLTLTSPTLSSKAAVDPALTPDGLKRRRAEYVSDAGARDASPLHADLEGLAPMLIQAGSHEILVGDAVALAGRVADADGHVELQVWPGVPHVFQGFAAMLDEGVEALDAAGRFLSRWLTRA